MIPLRLSIRNFLSYGDAVQTIDFVPHHMICLSGKNGHGKSALLDAMTWAIWGQARKIGGVAKADHGLLRLGQKSMAVVFDFMFNQSVYRIKREFTLTSGKAFVWLEFGLLDEATNTIISLSDKSITATQRKIEQLLGLNYDAFVNASFLRQGNANEFSKKSAKERKEVLCAILGLTQFEAIRKRASDSMRQLLAAQEATQAIQERLTEQLAKRTEIELLQQELAGKLPGVQALQEQLLRSRAAQQQQALLLQQIQAQDAALRAQLQEQQAAYATLWQQLRHNAERRRQIRFLLVGTGAQQQQEQLRQLEQQLQQQELLQQRYAELTVQQAAHKQQMQQLALAQTIAQQRETVQQQRTNALGQLQQLTLQTGSLQRLQQQLHKGKEGYARLVAIGNQTQAEAERLQQQQALLQTLRSPTCPLCTQALDLLLHAQLTNQLSATAAKLLRRVGRIALFLTRTKERLATEYAQLQQIERYNTELQKLAAQQEQYIYQEEQLTTQLQTMGYALQRAVLAEQWQEQQQQEARIAKDPALQYQAAVHMELQQRVREMMQQQASTTESHALQATVAAISDSLQQQMRAARELQAFIATTEQKLAALPSLQQVTVTVQAETLCTTTLEAEYQEAHQTITRLTATIQAQQAIIQQLEQEHAKHAALLVTYAAQINDLKTIAQAFSQDGIQALLIEQAIPEIEAEANRLLGRLTDNSAQIMIESLRDLKTGGTKETLDIKISDAIGIRPYEMFSGGEAFRIDFALRIAIAKLLARRAGTCLQTLIIDEGFGSQDDEGLQHIMDALYAIQDDFAKIIIVSHLLTMKESFPVHFVVQKGPNGSTVQVVQQG
ncbi:SMC family ATPase [Candidatus Dependentiae bacterium]|nr:SMC family ATPase [Candidatus Dependentiae bacterium]